MKENHIVTETLVGSAMLVLIFLFINPYNWVRVSEAFNVIAVFSLAVFFIFAVVIHHRPSNDERQEKILFLGERFGFLTGCGLLLIGLIVQASNNQVDNWLAACFTAMILAKIIGMIYAKVRY